MSISDIQTNPPSLSEDPSDLRDQLDRALVAIESLKSTVGTLEARVLALESSMTVGALRSANAVQSRNALIETAPLPSLSFLTYPFPYDQLPRFPEWAQIAELWDRVMNRVNRKDMNLAHLLQKASEWHDPSGKTMYVFSFFDFLCDEIWNLDLARSQQFVQDGSTTAGMLNSRSLQLMALKPCFNDMLALFDKDATLLKGQKPRQFLWNPAEMSAYWLSSSPLAKVIGNLEDTRGVIAPRMVLKPMLLNSDGAPENRGLYC